MGCGRLFSCSVSVFFIESMFWGESKGFKRSSGRSMNGNTVSLVKKFSFCRKMVFLPGIVFLSGDDL